jgi:hypothetical protein
LALRKLTACTDGEYCRYDVPSVVLFRTTDILGGLNWTTGTAVAAAIGALILLSSLPLAQYVVLRDHVRRSARWIPINMAAWLAGIVWTLLPSPWVDQSTSTGALILTYGIAGLCMAATVAVITGLGMIRLLRPFDVARSASLAGSKHAEGAYSEGLHSAGRKVSSRE